MEAGETKGRRARLGLEPLEERIAPAGGVVTGTVSGSMLTLTGDGADNSFTVAHTGLPDGEFHITGNDGTTVGLGGTLVVTGIKTIKINTLGGDDVIDLDGVRTAGNVSIDLGDGSDTVTLHDNCLIGGSLLVKGGAGDDGLGVYVSSIAKGLTFDAGEGHNALDFAVGNVMNGALTVKNGSGGIDISLDTLGVGKGFKLTSGAGDETVSVASSDIFGVTSLSFGDGASSFEATDSAQFYGVFSVKSGTGASAVSFINGADTWRAVSIVTGDGTAEFTAEHVDVAYDQDTDKLYPLKITHGIGDSSTILNNVFVGADMTVTSKGGNAELHLTDGDMLGVIFKAAGTGYVFITDSLVWGKLVLTGGAGNDVFRLDGVMADSPVTISTGAGADSVYIDDVDDPDGTSGTFNSSVKISLGDGDDWVRIGSGAGSGNSAAFDGRVSIDGGKGNDIADLVGNGNDFDFAPSIKNVETLL